MKTNLVLIGMAGSGKSSIGKIVGQQLGLAFIDVDLFIEQTTHQTIPELFEISEAHFRKIESAACKEIAEKENHTVIACGGGAVLHSENIEALKKTGWIVFIDRPIEHIVEDIEVGHRPLLKDGKNKLYQLQEERLSIYQSTADFIVKNHFTLEKVIDEIKAHLPEGITAKKGE